MNEALHLSDQEKEIVTDCIHKIKLELEHPIDKHSKQLIVRNIELLLDYCMRFYERQFITRNQENKDIIVKFEQLLDEYFLNQHALTEGLPSVKYFADKACLSPNYFGDLIKKETGYNFIWLLTMMRMLKAAELLTTTNLKVYAVCERVGIADQRYFSQVFRKTFGHTPMEYQKLNTKKTYADLMEFLKTTEGIKQ